MSSLPNICCDLKKKLLVIYDHYKTKTNYCLQIHLRGRPQQSLQGQGSVECRPLAVQGQGEL